MSEESSLIVGLGQRRPGSEQPLEQDLPVGTFLVFRQKNERVTQEQGGGHVAEVGRMAENRSVRRERAGWVGGSKAWQVSWTALGAHWKVSRGLKGYGHWVSL